MDNNKPLVSVVIPAYNIEPYIVECVESVQRQTYQNLEIIIVNDGSTDHTAEYCDNIAALDSRITVLHQQNGGVVSAREVGIDNSHGKFLAFIDGDDWVEPNMIEEMVRQIGKSDMVSVGVYRERFPGNIIKRVDKFKPGIYEGEQALSHIFKKMVYDQELGILQPMTPWIFNKLYLSSKVKKIHKEISKDITFAEDSVFLYKYMLEECESIVICENSFYHYRYRADSVIHAANEHRLIDINKVYIILKELFLNCWKCQELLFQLQKWVTVMTCVAVSEQMGFDDRINISEFVADMKNIADKNLILYGAGKVGRDTYRQLMEFDYDVLAWVDREYRHYQQMGLNVKSPADIVEYDYRTIIIAVENKKTADEIKKSLVENGIAEKSIIWNRPMKIY